MLLICFAQTRTTFERGRINSPKNDLRYPKLLSKHAHLWTEVRMSRDDWLTGVLVKESLDKALGDNLAENDNNARTLSLGCKPNTSDLHATGRWLSFHWQIQFLALWSADNCFASRRKIVSLRETSRHGRLHARSDAHTQYCNHILRAIIVKFCADICCPNFQ